MPEGNFINRLREKLHPSELVIVNGANQSHVTLICQKTI
jgi:hypothetical protein